MYRYSVDNAVTYTPNDFALYRESPFALWMERLTLENPEHGIPPDVGSRAPREETLPQDEIVETLREEGRNVVLIDWDMDESRRRAATLDAMRSGADFIVNGRLALGPLSADANLLMRTAGFSDLGDHLYIPCDTQARDSGPAAFRLCFLADLLHSLQGQLPPQMLLIRGDADVVSLQTEDHIYYYRAVKKRFMEAMTNFRKHRMPDPAESAHFGRWSECASEVLRQRAMSADYQQFEEDYEEVAELAAESSAEESTRRIAAGAGGVVASAAVETAAQQPQVAVTATLAEQARQLTPGGLKPGAGPGRTPNLARFPAPVPDRDKADDDPKPAQSAKGAPKFDEVSSEEADTDTPASDEPPVALDTAAAAPVDPMLEVSAADFFDDTLQDLAFIGSSLTYEFDTTVDADALVVTDGHQPAEKSPELPAVDAVDDVAVPREVPSVETEASLAETEAPRVEAEASLAETEASRVERTDAGVPSPTAAEEPAASRIPEPVPEPAPLTSAEPVEPPSPTLREVIPPEPRIEGYEVEMIDVEAIKQASSEPHLLSPERGAHGRDSAAGDIGAETSDSFVDLDSAPPPTLMPVNNLTQSEQADSVERKAADRDAEPGAVDKQASPDKPTASGRFSSSLITNEDYSDRE